MQPPEVCRKGLFTLLGLLAAAWGGWLGTASLPRYDQTVLREAAV
jgi:hypothetical protein